jgi:hypothetical protein
MPGIARIVNPANFITHHITQLSGFADKHSPQIWAYCLMDSHARQLAVSDFPSRGGSPPGPGPVFPAGFGLLWRADIGFQGGV